MCTCPQPQLLVCAHGVVTLAPLLFELLLFTLWCRVLLLLLLLLLLLVDRHSCSESSRQMHCLMLGSKGQTAKHHKRERVCV